MRRKSKKKRNKRHAHGEKRRHRDGKTPKRTALKEEGKKEEGKSEEGEEEGTYTRLEAAKLVRRLESMVPNFTAER